MCGTAALGDGPLFSVASTITATWRNYLVGDFGPRAPEFSGRRRMYGSIQNVAPVINQSHRGGMLRLAFLSAVVSLVVSFAAAAAPIPLYNMYRAEDGFTNAGISMAVVRP
jgi:hypothetical protein